MNDEANAQSLDDPRFQSLLVECLERLERGESLDRDELLRQHPRYAKPLAGFLDDLASLKQIANQVRDSYAEKPADAADHLFDETIDSNPKSSSVAAGDRIRYIGEYEILEEIARGGMGVVFKARQQKLNRVVALKMILAGNLANEADVERFHREAKAAGRLKHANIVPVHEIGQHEGHHYFTMDFVEGHSLAAEIRDESLPPRRAAELVTIVAEAIHFAHQQGTLHRDLKPANLLIDKHGQPHVTDFGLAKIIAADDERSRAELTASGQILGTPSYMSPEQAAGKQALIGPASDIYSLGAILYACLTGRAPFVADSPVDTLLQVMHNEPASPRSLNMKVPKDLETICLKCLAKEPHKRYGTARLLADDLQRYLDGRPVQARPVGRAARGWRWCRRNPLVAGLSTAMVLLLIVGCIVSTALAVAARRSATIATSNEQIAVAEKERANTQADLAARMADRADQQKEIAEQRLDKLHWQVYASTIGDAQHAWQERDVPRVDRLLSQCRWDFRGWEHDYLYSLLNANQQTFRGHTDTVLCVAVSPDGRSIASGSQDATIRVWNANRGRETLLLDGHDKWVSGIGFSRDGESIISGSGDKTIRIWHATTGEQKREIAVADMVRCLAMSAIDDRIVAGIGSQLFIFDPDNGEQLLAIDARQEPVTCLAISLDGKSIVSGSRDHSVKLWDASTGDEIRSFDGHTNYVTSVAFSPDASRVVSVAMNEQFKVWETATGRQIIAIQGPGRISSQVAYSPDGQWIVAGGDYWSPTIKLWDATNFQEVATLQGHQAGMVALAWDADGRHLASCSHDETVKRWDVRQPPPPLTIKAHENGSIGGLAFSPDGNRIATASGNEPTIRIRDAATGQELLTCDGGYKSVAYSPDGERIVGIAGIHLMVWNASTGEHIFTTKDPSHKVTVTSVNYSPDGHLIVSGGGYHDQTVKMWDAHTGEHLRTLVGHTNEVTEVVFSPDGRHVVSSSNDETIKIWDTASGDEIASLEGHTGDVQCVAFSPDGTRIVSGSFYGEVKVWDTVSGQEILSIAGHPGAVSSVAYSPCGRRIASGGNNGDRTVRIWNAMSGQELLTLEQPAEVYSVAFDGHEKLAAGLRDGTITVWDAKPRRDPLTIHAHRAEVNSVVFSRDGQQIVSGGGDVGTAIHVWDATTGQLTHTLAGHRAYVTSVALSPDDRTLASASKDKTVKLWDVRSGRETLALEGHTDVVTSVAFSHDGNRLASASADHTIRIWDRSSGDVRFTLEGHADSVTSVAFSSDGIHLISGSRDKSIKVWDATTGENTRTIETDAALNSVAIRHDGRHLASASMDRTIKIWSAKMGEELRTLTGHVGEVSSLDFSPDGQRLVSGSEDQTVREWDWRDGRELRTLRAHTGQVNGVAYGPHGDRIISGSTDRTVKVWTTEKER